MASKSAVISLCLLLLLSACGKEAQVQVIPMNTPYVVELTSDDVVRLLLYAGFSDDNILKFGTGLRNGLAIHGGTQINSSKDKVQAVFAVIEPGLVHVCTQYKGTFMYDVKQHKAVY